MNVERDFAQDGYRCRVEWGRRGARAAAARGDALVIVDTLSFSTAAVAAVQRGVRVRPCAWEDDPRQLAAREAAADTVHRRDVPERGSYSLSPASLLELPRGSRLVLASLNGATCARLAGAVPALFVGALVNASAMASAVDSLLQRADHDVTLVACGERWTESSDDGPLRVAIEDWIGAGAILAGIDAEKSPEARVAEAAFFQLRDQLGELLRECGSGRELCRMGFAGDVVFAAQVDVYDSVPALCGDWLVALS